MDTAIKTIELPDGHVFRLFYDDYTENPRYWSDPAINMYCWHRRDMYGDRHDYDTPDSLFETFEDGDIHLLIRGYDHGNMQIQLVEPGESPTWPYNDQWDSGWLGVMVCRRDRVKRDFGGDIDAVKRAMYGEVEVYNAYLAGEVYGYAIERHETCKCCGHVSEEVVESCGGYYGEYGLRSIHMDIGPGFGEIVKKGLEV